MRELIFFLLGCSVILDVVDTYLTRDALKTSNRVFECNPLAKWWMKNDFRAILFCVVITLFLLLVIAIAPPVFSVSILTALVVAKAIVCIHNYKVCKKYMGIKNAS